MNSSVGTIDEERHLVDILILQFILSSAVKNMLFHRIALDSCLKKFYMTKLII